MKMLDGGHDFQAVGFEVCKELDSNFFVLSTDNLFKIQSAYKADYYLADRRREDLSDGLVRNNQEFYLYDLNHVKAN
jgi:hypothetical protein